MPLKHELSALVMRRLQEMGLTSLCLAELAGVQPDIVEALFSTEDAQISLAEAEKMANAVGLALGVVGQRRRKDGDAPAFGLAAQTASTSYRDTAPISALTETLITGCVSRDYRPHIRALLVLSG